MKRYTDVQPADLSIEVETGTQAVMMPRIEHTMHGNDPILSLAHWHSYWKVNRVTGGSGLLIINGTQYTIQRGDIILIPPQHMHRICGTEHLMLEAYHFEMPPQADSWGDEEASSCLHHVGQSVPHVLSRTSPQCELLSEVLLDMMQELNQRELGYAPIVQVQCIRFLTLLNRYASKPQPNFIPAPSRGIQTMKEIIRVMEGKLAFPWTLKELSDLAHLSPSRFSALFQQTVGTSPLDYLIRLRLNYAAQLLTSSTDKIIEIAAESGFRNLSNFNRLFKDHFQMSPSELRDTNDHLHA